MKYEYILKYQTNFDDISQLHEKYYEYLKTHRN